MRTVPIGIAMLSVGGFYFLFTAAVYHTVPWSFVAVESLERDITAPGLLSYVLPGGWAVAIVAVRNAPITPSHITTSSATGDAAKIGPQRAIM